MQIREIPLSLIDIGERLRGVDFAYANVLAGSIGMQGQRTPIDVRATTGGRFALMAGAHRMAALGIAGQGTVQAIVHDVDDLTAQLIEVDENLMRHELTALDRAAFLHRRKEIYLQKFPQTKQGGKREKKQNALQFVLPLSFAKDAAKRLELTPRWVELLISFYVKLTPEVRRVLSGTRLADNAKMLMAIAGLPAAEQMPVAEEMLRADRPARTVQIAVKRLYDRDDPRAVSPRDQKYRRFIADWTVAEPELREAIVNFLRREGYKITAPRQGG